MCFVLNLKFVSFFLNLYMKLLTEIYTNKGVNVIPASLQK